MGVLGYLHCLRITVTVFSFTINLGLKEVYDGPESPYSSEGPTTS